MTDENSAERTNRGKACLKPGVRSHIQERKESTGPYSLAITNWIDSGGTVRFFREGRHRDQCRPSRVPSAGLATRRLVILAVVYKLSPERSCHCDENVLTLLEVSELNQLEEIEV